MSTISRGPVRVPALALGLAALLAPALAGCSLTGGASEHEAGDTADKTVVLVTHESFHLPKKLIREFEDESGYQLDVRASGDAGALTTKLVLTKDNPTGDVAFGVDNTFASRALDEGVFAEQGTDLPPGADQYALQGDGADRTVPVDVGDVCVNVDDTWFADHHVDPPASLDDLADPAYRGLFVTESALTSSPGLAFLLTTISAYGDDWQDYWQRLRDNDALVVDSWTDAYYGEFTQGGEDGTHPIVLSYDSSPAFTVPKGSDRSTTSALLDTCFQQVEYAGVLANADNPEGGQALLDFLLSDDVQAALPESMYVFPVADGIALPEEWATFAKRPTSPHQVDPSDIAENRDQWLEEWRDIVTQ